MSQPDDPTKGDDALTDPVVRVAMRSVFRFVNANNQLVGYGQTGRVKLTTLTKETFIPGFMERDEGEREKPFEKYPWVKDERGLGIWTTPNGDQVAWFKDPDANVLSVSEHR